MVFKGRFFSSKKSDSSNSPDGSTNSPKSIGSNSPSRSDKKKSKSDSKASAAAAVVFGGSSRQTQVKDALKKKDRDTQQPKTPIKSSLAGSTSTTTTTTTPKKSPAAETASVSPILASSLGLNRIKTRSGPLPQESFFGFRGDKGSALGTSNLSRPVAGDGSSGKKKEAAAASLSRMGINESGTSGNWADNGGDSDSMSTSSVPSREQSAPLSRLQSGGESSAEAARKISSRGRSGVLRSSELCTPEHCENPKESESPRFQAILHLTSAPRKRHPADIKSFSHELNSKGVRPFPFWKPRGLNNVEVWLVFLKKMQILIQIGRKPLRTY